MWSNARMQSTSFLISGLDPAPYRALFDLSGEALEARGAKRVVVESKPSAPCRITLEDAGAGEPVILLSYEHQPEQTPYRQQGPIFVRQAYRQAMFHNAIPPALAIRPLSLRGFDGQHMMTAAELAQEGCAREAIVKMFADPTVAYIHAHYARRGCYAALITRG